MEEVLRDPDGHHVSVQAPMPEGVGADPTSSPSGRAHLGR